MATTMLRVTTNITSSYINGVAVVRHYFDSAGGTEAAAQAAVTAFWVTVGTIMNGPTTIAVLPFVEKVTISNGKIVGGVGVTGSTASLGTAQENLPWATALLIQYRTGLYFNGRELRGRTFVPCMTEGNNTNGKPTSTIVATAAGAANTLIAASGADLVIWRRPVVDENGNVTRAGDSAPATAGACWNNWAQMRSRRD